MAFHSPFSNETLLFSNFSNRSEHECLFSGATLYRYIYSSLAVTNVVVLLPVCIYIANYGVSKWRQKRSSAATMSHADCFVYHMVIMEIIGIFRCFLSLTAIIKKSPSLFEQGNILFALPYYGEIFFHLLTCVERYLAAVYPIIYRSLRNQRGVRIRNGSIACVWLLCFFVGMMLMMIVGISIFVDAVLLTLSMIIFSFCSISVLCVLVRQPPGDKQGNKEKVHDSKRKAFYTISAILGVLLIRFFWAATWIIADLLGLEVECVMESLEVLLNLPSSLVLPLLFLYREGKLVPCKPQA